MQEIVHQIAVRDGFAYLAVGKAGVVIVDVRDPEIPVWVADYDTPGNAHDVAVEGRYVFVADDAAGIQVIDSADPAHPQTVATYKTLHCAHEVIVHQGTVYVAEPLGGLFVLPSRHSDGSMRHMEKEWELWSAIIECFIWLSLLSY